MVAIFGSRTGERGAEENTFACHGTPLFETYAIKSLCLLLPLLLKGYRPGNVSSAQLGATAEPLRHHNDLQVVTAFAATSGCAGQISRAHLGDPFHRV